MNTFKQLTAYLVKLGIETVPHSGKNYLAHLVGVYRLMQDHGCDEELCRAGMFHSIYGTEQFQGFKVPLEQRPEVRALIGERGERLGYLNCAVDRATLDSAVLDDREPFCVKDRIADVDVQLTRTDFDDLCRVHLFDWLEQVPRSRLGWDYRRDAYRRLADRLEVTALYERVFASEPKERTS